MRWVGGRLPRLITLLGPLGFSVPARGGYGLEQKLHRTGLRASSSWEELMVSVELADVELDGQMVLIEDGPPLVSHSFGPQALVSRAIVGSMLSPNAQGAGLAAWLDSLVLTIPSTTIEQSGTTITIVGTCRHLALGRLRTEQLLDGSYDVSGEGFGISCDLDLGVKALLIKTEGKVVATIADSSIAGALIIGTDSGTPRLPDAIESRNCKGHFQVTTLHFSGDLLLKFLGLLSPIVKNYLNDALGSIICDAVAKRVNVQGTAGIQSANKKLRAELAKNATSPPPPAKLPEPNADFAGVSTNPLIKMLSRLLERCIGNLSYGDNVNSLITRGFGPSGNISLLGLGVFPLNFMVDLNKLGLVKITLRDLSIGGMNTWQTIAMNSEGRATSPDVFNVQRQQLNLSMALSNLSFASNVTIDVTPYPDSPIFGEVLTESFTINVGLRDLALGGSVYLAANATYLRSLSMDQLPTYGCAARGIYDMQIQQGALTLGDLSIHLNPEIPGALEQDLDTFINLILGGILSQFSEAISDFLNHEASITMRDDANTLIRLGLFLAPACREAERYGVYPGAAVVCMWIALGFLVIALPLTLVLGFGFRVWRLRQKRARIRSRRAFGGRLPSLDSLPDIQISQRSRACSLVETMESGEKTHTAEAGSDLAVRRELGPKTVSGSAREVIEAALGAQNAQLPRAGSQTLGRLSSRRRTHFIRWDCLASHPRVTPALSLAMPVLVVITVFLFLGSNLTVGARVIASVTVNGESVATLPSLFEFSLVNSITDMIDAKVYPIALLIIVFSGMWPYAKLFLLIACWLLPTETLSVARRQQLLNFLDAYGKWSLVDTLFLVIFSVAFNVILSPEVLPEEAQGILNDSDAHPLISVYVLPDWGFHAFVAASLISLALGMTMTATHRYALEIGEYEQDQGQFITGLSRLCNKMRPRDYISGKIFVYAPLAALFFSLILVLVGIFEPSFRFNFRGLTAYLLGPERSDRTFSVYSMGKQIPLGNPEPRSLGILWIQAVFVFFCVVFVIVYHAILIVLWCAPLSAKWQRKFLIIAQVCNAWSGLDVFCLSMCASVLEIQQFAKFLVGTKCDLIDELIAKSSVARSVPGPLTCFDVTTQLLDGFWLLASAALLSGIIGHYMLRRCSQALCAPVVRQALENSDS